MAHSVQFHAFHRCPVWLRAVFINDTWALRQEIMKYKSTGIHHALGIGMISAAIALVPKHLDWLIGPFYLTEGSTVLLSLMWLAQTYGHGKSPAYGRMALAFVVLFFLLRVLMLPRFVLYLRQQQQEMFKAFGRPIRCCFYGVALLQWYWFGKIMRKFLPAFSA